MHVLFSCVTPTAAADRFVNLGIGFGNFVLGNAQLDRALFEQIKDYTKDLFQSIKVAVFENLFALWEQA